MGIGGRNVTFSGLKSVTLDAVTSVTGEGEVGMAPAGGGKKCNILWVKMCNARCCNVMARQVI